MFLKSPKASTDPRVRSLLQKAARRGFTDVVDKALVRLDKSGDKTWLRSRAIIITFEECWPLAKSLSISREISSKRNALFSVCKATKQKDAAGLGALAYAYKEGDRSMLDCVPDPQLLKLVSEALQRPASFFDWVRGQSEDESSKDVIRVAEQYLPAATWEWDKACILAGALLSTTGNLPTPDLAQIPKENFPYWIALDKHTPQGKLVLNEVAVELNSSYRKLIWASFYFESSLVNKLLPSLWWEAEKTWRLRKTGLTLASAETLWSRASNLMREKLRGEAALLQKVIYDNFNELTPKDELFKSEDY